MSLAHPSQKTPLVVAVRKGSWQWHRLRTAKVRLRAKHKQIMRDLEHKISRMIVYEAQERQAGTIALGDVRDVADTGTLGKQENQKVSTWSHGTVRAYVTYKAAAAGIAIELVNEAYTSQTCPHCGTKHKPHRWVYTCRQCGFSGHRDVVGQINILSQYRYGEVGKIATPAEVKHRILHNLRVMRRRPDTGQSAAAIVCGEPQEAAGV